MKHDEVVASDQGKNSGGTNRNGRIEALKERERQIRAAIAMEQERRAKRIKRETAKLESLIGGACLKGAAVSPEFQLMLKQTIDMVVTDEAARRFLNSKGWL